MLKLLLKYSVSEILQCSVVAHNFPTSVAKTTIFPTTLHQADERINFRLKSEGADAWLLVGTKREKKA